MKSPIFNVLCQQSHDIRDLDVGYTIPRRESLSAFEFLRDFVSKNKPVVIVGAIQHWNALHAWKSDDYLVEKTNDAVVTVAMTPQGLADCPTLLSGSSCWAQPSSAFELPTADIAVEQDSGKEHQPQNFLANVNQEKDEDIPYLEESKYPARGKPEMTGEDKVEWCFALPWQEKMHFSEFLKLLRHKDSTVVPYCQFQNSSLTVEFAELVDDVDEELEWATEAFGTGGPEAVNIWIGDQRSRTSFHRDYYENIYCIIKGYKTFRLLPPTDVFRMQLKRWPLAKYSPIMGSGNENAIEPITASSTANLALNPVLCEPPQTILWSSFIPKCPVPSNKRDLNYVCATEPIAPGSVCSFANSLNTNAESIANEKEHCIDWYSKSEKSDDTDTACNLEDLPNPLTVTIGPGEILYLPSCWWHEVYHGNVLFPDNEEKRNSKCNIETREHDFPFSEINGVRKKSESFDNSCIHTSTNGLFSSDVAIAVNYWYEMSFNHGFVAAKTIEALSVELGLNES